MGLKNVVFTTEGIVVSLSAVHTGHPSTTFTPNWPQLQYNQVVCYLTNSAPIAYTMRLTKDHLSRNPIN